MQLNAITRAEVTPDLPMPSDVALAAFDDLRHALLAPKLLALPTSKVQMIVHVDACADPIESNFLKEQRDCTIADVPILSSPDKNSSAHVQL